MKKVLKWGVILLGLLLLLVVAAILSLPFLIDPNDYKQEISQLIEDKTGRRIEIPGQVDLKVSTALELSFELGAIQVASSGPFADTTLLSSEHASIQASLWPLLKDRQLVVNRLALRDVHLTLIRDREGRVNWAERSQPIKETPPETQDQKSSKPGLASIDIGGIEAANVNLLFTDQQTNTSVRLEQFNLQAGHIRPEQQFPLSADFQLTLDRKGQPQLSTSVQLDSKLTLIPAKGQYLAEQLNIETRVNSDQLPGKTITFQLAMDSDINLAGQEITIRNLVFDQGVLHLRGNLGLNNFAAPAVSGHVEIQELAPLAYLADLGLTAPAFAEPTALQKMAAELDFTASPEQVASRNIRILVDETAIEASLELDNLSNPVITLTAAIDQLDLDRYRLAKQEEETTQPTSATAGASPPENGPILPVDTLRNLNFASEVNIQELKVNKLSLTNVEVKARGKEGQIRLDPVAAKLYGGSVTVNGSVDAGKDIPVLTISKRIKEVALGPLLNDLTGRQEISGRADIEADVTTRGLTRMELNRNMNGTMSIQLADGEITRLKILDTIRRAKAIVDQEPMVASAADQPTGFAKLSATGAITSGVFTNNDLLAQSDLMKITGKGTADLATQQIDYLLTVYLTDRVGRQEDSGLVALGNRPIPYRIKGTFTELQQSAAVGELLKSEIKNVLMDELQKQLGVKDTAPAKEAAPSGSSKETSKEALDPGSLIQKGLKGLFGN